MIKKISGSMKTHDCGELGQDHLGLEVTICGYIHKYRNLGGLHFIDLWDRKGIVQLSFEDFKGDPEILKTFSLESVVKTCGTVRPRPDEARNPKMKTGEIEVAVTSIELLSPSTGLPFLPRGQIQGHEDLRLRYRYLDLRTQRLQDILTLRARMNKTIRDTLTEYDFTEVETPILYKSTPEGARDYIVPSRLHPGKVYALPQSPQTLKQLLMIGGTDRYFQITKCFRDEDLRADRQPEFTQLDIEAAYSSQEFIKNLTSLILERLFDLSGPPDMETMSYQKAMELYGTDRPDIRFELLHHDVTSLFSQSPFAVFSDVAKEGGLIKSIFLPKSCGELSRKDLDGLAGTVKPLGGKGVAWFKVQNGQKSGGISKWIGEEEWKALVEKCLEKNQEERDGLFLFFADTSHTRAHLCADAIRRLLGDKLDLIGQGHRFLWVNDFPLLSYSEKDQRFYALHHPFTRPRPEDRNLFLKGDQKELEGVKADAYDLIIDGHEVGGGSMRIYDPQDQTRMFDVLGFSSEETKRQFGFFIEALQYGTPPHGGIAFGLDRMAMILAETGQIRDVIAFPKTTSASDLMSETPSKPSPEQLEELKMKFL
ncbi:MAG: aspartate--tRNA ligase [Bacteriovoracales bacterium]|nr:aspartate--tRNA ligase [Bacteriovoracales bacterium]